MFETLCGAKVLVARWRLEYNHNRLHSTLVYRPPAQKGVPVDGSVYRLMSFHLALMSDKILSFYMAQRTGQGHTDLMERTDESGIDVSAYHSINLKFL